MGAPAVAAVVEAVFGAGLAGSAAGAFEVRFRLLDYLSKEQGMWEQVQPGVESSGQAGSSTPLAEPRWQAKASY